MYVHSYRFESLPFHGSLLFLEIGMRRSSSSSGPIELRHSVLSATPYLVKSPSGGGCRRSE